MNETNEPKITALVQLAEAVPNCKFYPKGDCVCRIFGYYRGVDKKSFGSVFRLLIQRSKSIPHEKYCLGGERQALARVLYGLAPNDASGDFKDFLGIKKLGYYEVTFDLYDHGPYIEHHATRFIGDTLPESWMKIIEFNKLHISLINGRNPGDKCNTCYIDEKGNREYPVPPPSEA